MTEIEHSSKPSGRSNLMGTVAAATLAGAVVFTLFYLVGAVIGLAVMAALGVALVVGIGWAAMRLRRLPALVRAKVPARRT